MQNLKIYLLIFSCFLAFLIFTSPALAVIKTNFPDVKVLQPMPTDIGPDLPRNINTETNDEDDSTEESQTEEIETENLYVTPTGAGNKDGSDWNNAFAGLDGVVWGKDSLGQLGAGDTLWIAGGQYPSALELKGNGTAENPIFIKQAPLNNLPIVINSNSISTEQFDQSQDSHVIFDQQILNENGTNIVNTVNTNQTDKNQSSSFWYWFGAFTLIVILVLFKLYPLLSRSA